MFLNCHGFVQLILPKKRQIYFVSQDDWRVPMELATNYAIPIIFKVSKKRGRT